MERPGSEGQIRDSNEPRPVANASALVSIASPMAQAKRKATKSVKTAVTKSAAARKAPARKTAATKTAATKIVVKTAPTKIVTKTPPKRVPFAELQARKELVLRALDDVREILADADPVGDPKGFVVLEKRALAIFDEINSLVPPMKPLTPAAREKLKRELADKPDDETLRAMLMEMEKMLDDPKIPAEMKAVISRDQIHEALRGLDEVALLAPVVSKIQSLVDGLHTPRAHDPKAALMREDAEKAAARRRS